LEVRRRLVGARGLAVELLHPRFIAGGPGRLFHVERFLFGCWEIEKAGRPFKCGVDHLLVDAVMRYVEETHFAAGLVNLPSDGLDVLRAAGKTWAQIDDRDALRRDRGLIDEHEMFSCER